MEKRQLSKHKVSDGNFGLHFFKLKVFIKEYVTLSSLQNPIYLFFFGARVMQLVK